MIPPPLSDIEEYYWEAFWELGTDRQSGMGVGPIPRRSILQYEEEYPELNPNGVFGRIIRDMDSLYMTHGKDK